MQTGQLPDLTGKVMVVTGANAGIGKETAAALAAAGATVVMTARDPERGRAALDEVRARTGSDQLVLGDLDLASFASIRAFAAWLLDRFDRLDVLVCNAGLILDERRETAEGFEMVFGVNHLGHFLLVQLLEERLVASAPSRVVVVSSAAHRVVRRPLRHTDLQARDRFRGFTVYGRSKLANAQFAAELDRRLAPAGVRANAVHPGSINSNFAGDGDAGIMGWFIARLGRYVLSTPEQGARTSVLAAASDRAPFATDGGRYLSHGRPRRASRQARDPQAAGWLWAYSQRLVDAVS